MLVARCEDTEGKEQHVEGLEAMNKGTDVVGKCEYNYTHWPLY